MQQIATFFHYFPVQPPERLPCLILFDYRRVSFPHVVLQVFGLVLSTLSVALLFEKVFRSEALGRYCNTLGEAPTSALIVFLRLGAKSRAVG